jgi:hypothetical protein
MRNLRSDECANCVQSQSRTVLLCTFACIISYVFLLTFFFIIIWLLFIIYFYFSSSFFCQCHLGKYESCIMYTNETEACAIANILNSMKGECLVRQQKNIKVCLFFFQIYSCLRKEIHKGAAYTTHKLVCGASNDENMPS